MLMNAAEKILMDNPVRRASQRYYETPWLLRMAGRAPVGRTLEIGCGTGYGVRLILERFGATSVDAVDLDPERLAKARRRLERRIARGLVRLHRGDAAALPWPDEHFDSVFDFGIIHHVPEWRDSVTEVARVLRPGGRFFFEEVTKQALERKAFKVLLEHPAHDRFTTQQFADELERQGLLVGGRLTQPMFGDYLLGVAVKPRSE